MARNQFGCICDKCGKYSKNRKEFYHLILPTCSLVSNDTRTVDFCFDCYKELKHLLNNYMWWGDKCEF